MLAMLKDTTINTARINAEAKTIANLKEKYKDSDDDPSGGKFASLITLAGMTFLLVCSLFIDTISLLRKGAVNYKYRQKVLSRNYGAATQNVQSASSNKTTDARNPDAPSIPKSQDDTIRNSNKRYTADGVLNSKRKVKTDNGDLNDKSDVIKKTDDKDQSSANLQEYLY